VFEQSEQSLGDVAMTHALPNSRVRRTSLFAAVIFGVAYIGALVFIFAPEGMLSSHLPEATSASQP
jgi:hypothetical protein